MIIFKKGKKEGRGKRRYKREYVTEARSLCLHFIVIVIFTFSKQSFSKSLDFSNLS